MSRELRTLSSGFEQDLRQHFEFDQHWRKRCSIESSGRNKDAALMSDTYDWLIHDHTQYESLLHDCLTAVGQDDWEAVADAFAKLHKEVLRHMEMEDEVLYPAYLRTEGLPRAPVTALQQDHKKIASLLSDVETLLQTRNSEHVQQSFLPLEQTMITHHEREEDLFLPMASYLMLEQKEDLLRQLGSFQSQY